MPRIRISSSSCHSWVPLRGGEGAALPDEPHSTVVRVQAHALPLLTCIAHPLSSNALPWRCRQGIVGAASIHHLCKSIVIENTRAHPSGELLGASGQHAKGRTTAVCRPAPS